MSGPNVVDSRASSLALAGVLASTLICYALIGFCYGEIHLAAPLSGRIVGERSALLAGVIGLAIFGFGLGCRFLGWLLKRPEFARFGQQSQAPLAPAAFLLGPVALLVGDVVGRKFGFFSTSSRGIDLLYCGLFIFLSLLLWRRGRLPTTLGIGVVLLLQIFLVAVFIQSTSGHLVYSDDHPSFLYRFQLLRDRFPNIPFYNTDWNGGYWAKEFYAVGALNVFILASPILFTNIFGDIRTIEGMTAYNALIPYLFIFLMPWGSYRAARLLGSSKWAALATVLLALLPTLGFFEWLLKYGTMGFCTSVSLYPWCFALSYRLLCSEEEPAWRDVIELLLIGSLSLMWSLTVVPLLPLALVAVCLALRSYSAHRAIKLGYFVAAFLLINGLWIYSFIHESKVFSFLSASALPGTKSHVVSTQPNVSLDSHTEEEEKVGADFRKKIEIGVQKFRDALGKFNPLVLFLTIPGLWYLRSRRLRWAIVLTLMWLSLLVAFGDLVKPQLELRRMAIFAGFLLSIVAGVGFSQLVERMFEFFERTRFRLPKLGAAMLLVPTLGIVGMAPLTLYGVYAGRTEEHYTKLSDEATRFIYDLRAQSDAGRTVFLGFILHDFGATSYDTQDGGHIAPLATLTGKEIYAFDFTHSRWSAVDPIPLSFRKRGTEGIEEFLDLIDATSVVTFRKEWADYCRGNSRYREQFQHGRFRYFSRIPAPGDRFVLSGSAEVKRLDRARLSIQPRSPEVVLKYRYTEQLRLLTPQSGVELEPVVVFEEEVGGGVRADVSYVKLTISEALLGRGESVVLGTE